MANSPDAEARIAFLLLKESYVQALRRKGALQLQELGRSLGLSEAVIHRAYDFLLTRHFIRPLAKDAFAVSDKGRDAVEWELSRPSFLSEPRRAL